MLLAFRKWKKIRSNSLKGKNVKNFRITTCSSPDWQKFCSESWFIQVQKKRNQDIFIILYHSVTLWHLQPPPFLILSLITRSMVQFYLYILTSIKLLYPRFLVIGRIHLPHLWIRKFPWPTLWTTGKLRIRKFPWHDFLKNYKYLFIKYLENFQKIKSWKFTEP